MSEIEKSNSTIDKAIRPDLRVEAFLAERQVCLPVESETRRRASKSATSAAQIGVENVALTRLNALNAARLTAENADQTPGKTTRRASGKREAIDPTASNWLPIGPSALLRGQAATKPVTSGRMRGFAIVPGGSRVYAASANGGVWRSTDRGRSWHSLMDSVDFLPGDGTLIAKALTADSLACGAIGLAPGLTAEQDTIFVGSGEGGSGEYNGIGPLVSTNGGLDWNREHTSGADADALVGANFFALVVDPVDKQRVVAATSKGIFRRELVGGVPQWVLKDAAKGLAVAWFSSVVVARQAGTTTYFAAQWGAGVFTSSDGDVWTPLPAAGYPAANIGLVKLAISPDNIHVLYAQIAVNGVAPLALPAANPLPVDGHLQGLYRFDAQPAPAWRQVSGAPVNLFGPTPTGPGASGGQGNYDNAIAVDPNNVNRLIIGGSYIPSDAAGAILAPGAVADAYSYGSALFRLEVNAPAGGAAACTPFFIGSAVHADVHAIEFEPGNSQRLWVGSDGGAYLTTRPGAQGSIFEHKNTGLQTMTMLHFGAAIAPYEEAVLFCGTQDNGGQRYLGDAMWLHSTPGDAGFFVVNWDNPCFVVSTGYNTGIRFSTDGGTNRDSLGLPVVGGESLEFYSPLVGTPPPPGQVPNAQPTVPSANANANLVAFGTERVWISHDFGLTRAGWLPIPSNVRLPASAVNNPINAANLLADSLGSNIKAMVFASATRLVVGTVNGQIFQYDFAVPSGAPVGTAPSWQTPVRKDNLGPVGNNLGTVIAGLAPNPPVLKIVMFPGSVDKFYITLGGFGVYPHCWLFDGSVAGAPRWEAKDGTGTKLPNVVTSTIAVDPNPAAQNLFVGTDIGVYRSSDGGANWVNISKGLPDAAVIDLHYLPVRGARTAILRAATHGRGVFERRIADTPSPLVELFVRHTQLDLGYGHATDGFQNFARPTEKTTHRLSPDIRIDTPNQQGIYQFSADPHDTIDFAEFVEKFPDEAENLPFLLPIPGNPANISAFKTAPVMRHPSASINSRVYVQAHNRGSQAADNVRVTLLLSSAPTAAAPNSPPVAPNLPADLSARIQAGASFSVSGWTTVGTVMLQNLRAGFPQIAAFNLTAELLTAIPAGGPVALVAVFHHEADPFNSAQLNPHTLCQTERKAAMKIVLAKDFTGTIPATQRLGPLAGFIKIPPSATAANASYDSFLADSFRRNDLFLEKKIKTLLASTLASTGTDGDLTTTNAPSARPHPGQIVLADNLQINTPIVLDAKTPLIWIAKNQITINALINANGKGAINTDLHGDFGGAGGGAAGAAGKPCKLPLNGFEILPGGQANSPGSPLPENWASRALLQPALCRGGAAGGGPTGGAGGGVVILCAPVIRMDAAGAIEAKGLPGGAGNDGGGGGGLVILIAAQFVGDIAGKVSVIGGAGIGTGGAGGAGLLLRRLIS